MDKTLSSELIATHSKPRAQCAVKTLLARLDSCHDSSCFILAPRKCGQDELLDAYLGHQSAATLLSIFEVDDRGNCVLVEEKKASATNDLPAEIQVALISFVPWLEDEAAQQFSQNINAFAEEGHRVIVFCPVQNDRYQVLQAHRLEISARELKQSECLAPESYGACLKQFMGEFLPLQVRLAAVLAAALGQTDLDELERLGYEVSSDIPVLLEELNPLFVSTHAGRGVRSEPLPLSQIEDELCQALREYLGERGQLASVSALAGKITALSIVLLEKGDLETSHQVLSIAEELISEGVSQQRTVGFRRAAPNALLSSVSTALDSINTTVDGNNTLNPMTRAFQHLEADSRAATSIGTRKHWPVVAQPSVPPLYLRLFGKLEVYVEGVPLANKHLSRTKIRRLLAYLALNQQRAVSRDSLIDYLWPYLDFDRAQKNLYTSWCMLAKGLGSEKVRECPYIQRNGETYQLNSSLVICDTQQFEDIARSVLFGGSESGAPTDHLFELETLYCDSLVADIPVDSFIGAKMEGYRSMMVGSLLLATRQLRNAGELEKALYCARTAYELDESREDVYRELMDTQLGAGQRTSAMQTYFSCKRYLSDELGILPSKSTTALYQDLLLDNCR